MRPVDARVALWAATLALLVQLAAPGVHGHAAPQPAGPDLINAECPLCAQAAQLRHAAAPQAALPPGAAPALEPLRPFAPGHSSSPVLGPTTSPRGPPQIA